MVTTIQVSESLQKELSNLKFFERETYEEVIWDLIEDRKELSKETLKHIEISEKQIKKGEFYTHEEIKKELGL